MSAASLIQGTPPAGIYAGPSGSGAQSWSQYPATQTVEMAGNQLSNPKKITLRETTLQKPAQTFINATSQTTLWRDEGDATLRINNGNELEASGYLMDSLLNPPTFATDGYTVNCSALTTGPQGPQPSVVSSFEVPTTFYGADAPTFAVGKAGAQYVDTNTGRTHVSQYYGGAIETPAGGILIPTTIAGIATNDQPWRCQPINQGELNPGRAFTISWWAYWSGNAVETPQVVLKTAENRGYEITVDAGGTLTLSTTTNPEDSVVFPNAMAVNTWQLWSLSVARSDVQGNNCFGNLYRNGVALSDALIPFGFVAPSGDFLYGAVGANEGSPRSPFQGTLAQIAISQEQSWDTNYSPPAFPDLNVPNGIWANTLRFSSSADPLLLTFPQFPQPVPDVFATNQGAVWVPVSAVSWVEASPAPFLVSATPSYKLPVPASNAYVYSVLSVVDNALTLDFTDWQGLPPRQLGTIRNFTGSAIDLTVSTTLQTFPPWATFTLYWDGTTLLLR